MASGKRVVECPQEPFVATVAVQEGKVEVEVGFMAHYGEPPLTLALRLDGEQSRETKLEGMSQYRKSRLS